MSDKLAKYFLKKTHVRRKYNIFWRKFKFNHEWLDNGQIINHKKVKAKHNFTC